MTKTTVTLHSELIELLIRQELPPLPSQHIHVVKTTAEIAVKTTGKDDQVTIFSSLKCAQHASCPGTVMGKRVQIMEGASFSSSSTGDMSSSYLSSTTITDTSEGLKDGESLVSWNKLVREMSSYHRQDCTLFPSTAKLFTSGFMAIISACILIPSGCLVSY
jgi:hypothetical protein